MQQSPERVELPAAFEDVDVDILARLIADMMERLMAHNDQIPLSPKSLTRFHSRSAPGISVLDYLRRIIKFTKAERSCLLITLHYIDQISVRMPVFVLSSLTCHRFVITSICVSSKCLCDAFHSNSVYAKVGGIPVTELNVLEREFLRMIDWNLTCTREVLQEYYVNLVRTYSKGGFVIADASSSSISSDSDMDYETSPQASPIPTPQPSLQILQAQRLNGSGPSARSSSSGRREQSTILVDPATLAPESPNPPTVEQNMAFAALQQQSEPDMDLS
ncbi:cyclin-domain-containing protein [Dichomitus squalens LYAD-421 SS1]|uniref:cyclin-domain-containing protein n=1 Tax=Dichomitus squalens (strain LYAD-421) TaxID=732165 RepID=UPI00044117AA|nr:cyclin-domain-containing protein [Dichomitus squalens LYAD-421 SS1]EJF65098.1 cyclin-domain-containing protein [Dichomitus squalens LYAD-421 SS1]